MNYPFISVAIACYNIQDYIEDCLNSVIHQSLQNIEILCIDDCSNDNTVEIIKRYQSLDKRIKLIQKKKNEGLSSSRNDAIELANGRYICFIDGDDLLNPELLKKAYNVAEENKSDLVIWDYVVFENEKDIIIKSKTPSTLNGISEKDKKHLIQLPAFTWLKLIKTDKLRKSKISFPIGLTKQDIPFHWNVILNFSHISILPERLIFYRQRSSAASYQSGISQLDVVKILQILEKSLNEQGKYQSFKEIFHKQKLNTMYSMYDRVSPRLKTEAKVAILQNLNQADKNFIIEQKNLIKQARYFYKMLLGSKLNGIYYYSWLTIRAIYRNFNAILCI